MKKVLFLMFFLSCHYFLGAQVVINPCAPETDLHIVVIGSSTAAGAGPSNSANAWVNRYRDYLQNINPNNVVTNLAVGGTKTYNIMPDWFVPPSNRPSPNPANNITQAITLGADAIIVNMPSNDGGWGYSINEQMFNFITIANSADSAGVATWICTTQPRNFSNAQKAIQIGVRDSILSYFGPFAIDFWTGFADANNDIDSMWDSGDGIHMNDTAHGVLHDRVVAAGIPNIVSDTLNYIDHKVDDIYLTNTSICGDSNTILHVVVSNIGTASLQNELLQAQQINNVNSSSTNLPVMNISNLGSCISDTFSYAINSYTGIDYSFSAFIQNSSDQDISNDSSGSISLLTKGHPTLSVLNDTIPSGSNALLTASASANDTIIWYDASSNGNIIGFGVQYPINNVTTNETVFAEAVRGPLHFEGSLFTQTNSTTDWNGMMFDIVATDTVTIDSLRIKVHATGPQTIVGYNRQGSLVGNELNAGAWNSWGTDNVNAINEGDFQTVDFPDVTIFPNDTLGVYVSMQTSSSRLSYLNSAAITYADSKIQLMNGAGVSHSFGASFSPRNFSGEVFYHYGFNPNGYCSTDRLAVSAIVLWPTLNTALEKIDLKIVPNPSTGYLKFVGDKLPSKVQVSNMNGQIVKDVQLENAMVQLDGLSQGMYLLSFTVEGKEYRQKIMLR